MRDRAPRERRGAPARGPPSGARRPELAAAFLLLTPLYFRLSYATLTETVAGLCLAGGTYLLLVDRSRAAALCFGLAPLARHELVVYLPALWVYLAWRRDWTACLVSIAPTVLWNVGDYLAVGDLPLRRSAGIERSGIYGSGSPMHFVARWLEGSGLALTSLGFAGAVLGLAGRWPGLDPEREPRWRIAIARAVPVAALGLVALHSVLFLPGLAVSGGYARFLAPASPWLAISAAFATERLLEGIRARRGAPAVILLVLAGAGLALRAAWLDDRGFFAGWDIPVLGARPWGGWAATVAFFGAGLAALLLPRRRAPSLLFCALLAALGLWQWRAAARPAVRDAEDVVAERVVREVRATYARDRHPLYALHPSIDWYDRAVTRWTIDHWPPADWSQSPPGALLVYDLHHLAGSLPLSWVEQHPVRLVAVGRLHEDDPVPFMRVYLKEAAPARREALDVSPLLAGSSRGMSKEQRALVFCRAGERSLHRKWIGDPATRSYDVWLDCYCAPEPWAGEPARVTDGRGTTKWLRIAALLRERPEEFDPYDVVFFPDDDLDLSAPALEEFFALFRRHRLVLAAPALRDGCFWSHELTLANAAFQLRYTNFVEVMAPAFSRAALRACAPTFDESRTGWGIDYVWSRVLGDPPDAIAVVDATPMVHTRPVGGGGFYALGGDEPWEEMRATAARHGVELPFGFRQFGGILRGGVRVERRLFLARAFLGAPPSQRWRAHFWKIMRASLSR